MNPPVLLEANIEVDEELVRLVGRIAGIEVISTTVEQLAMAARELWLLSAAGHDIRGNYVRKIQEPEVELLPATPNGLAFAIRIANTHKLARIVEDGHAAFHLPSRIDWSGPKVKHGKHGPYLHIPFRHRAHVTDDRADDLGFRVSSRRAILPQRLYAEAAKLRSRIPLRQGPIYDADGKYVAADRYRWTRKGEGTRLDGDGGGANYLGGTDRGAEEHQRSERIIAGRINGRPAVNPAWQTSKYAGLFKTGDPGHTAYLTVRTITPTSQGWNIPARVGLGIVREATARLRADAQEEFENLLEDNLRGVL